MKLNQQSDSQLESMDWGCRMAVTGYTCSHLDSGVVRQAEVWAADWLQWDSEYIFSCRIYLDNKLNISLKDHIYFWDELNVPTFQEIMKILKVQVVRACDKLTDVWPFQIVSGPVLTQLSFIWHGLCAGLNVVNWPDKFYISHKLHKHHVNRINLLSAVGNIFLRIFLRFIWCLSRSSSSFAGVGIILWLHLFLVIHFGEVFLRRHFIGNWLSVLLTTAKTVIKLSDLSDWLQRSWVPGDLRY